MSTQLRLVEPPEPSVRPASGTVPHASKGRASNGPAKGGQATRARRGRSQGGAAVRSRRDGRSDSRRAASWGEWRLDAGTRRVGRAGVAEARRVLEAALETSTDDRLSEAS